MLRYNIIVILSGLLTTSCAVIKDVTPGQIIKVEKSDFKKLSGQFSNYPTTTQGIVERDMDTKEFETHTLWSQLDGFKEVGSKTTFENQTVTINFISDRKAKAELWVNGELKKTKKIRGKIKDGYFYRRPYFVAIPLVPLFFGYKTFRYRIGLTDNAIVVDYKWNFWGFVVIAGNYSEGQSNSVFNKK
jgi:hypothetical protein